MYFSISVYNNKQTRIKFYMRVLAIVCCCISAFVSCYIYTRMVIIMHAAAMHANK